MQQQSPFFSIITATFNSAKTLDKCLRSLFAQTFVDWELIVIDGLSTDGTLDLLKKYKKEINTLLSEKDSGIYDAMNKGIKKATGSYIYFLNSDDQFADDHVLQDVYDFAASKFFPELITANVDKIYSHYKVHKNKQLTMENLKRGLMPPHQATFTKKAVFERLGAYRNCYKSSGDFEFACKMHANGIDGEYYDRLIAFFASGGQSSKKEIAYFETFQILKDYFGNFWAMLFYIKKIIVEQQIKKMIDWIK